VAISKIRYNRLWRTTIFIIHNLMVLHLGLDLLV